MQPSKRRSLALLLLALTVLFLAAACGSKRVRYLDGKDVTLASAQETRQGGFLSLRLGFQGTSSGVYHTVYRVDWLDEDGEVMESTSWRPVIVRGGLMVHATEQSTVPGARSYTVVLSNREK